LILDLLKIDASTQLSMTGNEYDDKCFDSDKNEKPEAMLLHARSLKPRIRRGGHGVMHGVAKNYLLLFMTPGLLNFRPQTLDFSLNF